MDDLELHSHLIGQQGSRAALNTPVLVLDLDALDRNVATMAAALKAKGVGSRPHAKTHKSIDIAKRQLAAGALGVCCAKIGEAEAMIRSIKGAPLLLGARGRPVTDVKALAQVLSRLSQFAAQAGPRLRSVDLNPVFAMPEGQGAWAADAVLEVQEVADGAES